MSNFIVLQANFEIFSYFTNTAIGGVGLLVSALSLLFTVYTFAIAKKAMSDWQTQRDYDVIIEALIEAEKSFDEVKGLRKPPERSWNDFDTSPDYPFTPKNGLMDNLLFYKFGVRSDYSSFEKIVKKLELQIGENPLLAFIRDNLKTMSELKDLMEYYANKEVQNSPNCYDTNMKSLWDYIFETSDECQLAKRIEKEYLEAKNWGESKIKKLRSNFTI